MLAFYVAKFLEAAGIGTFLIAILIAMNSPDLSIYGTMLPIGGACFLAGWLLEKRLRPRP